MAGAIVFNCLAKRCVVDDLGKLEDLEGKSLRRIGMEGSPLVVGSRRRHGLLGVRAAATPEKGRTHMRQMSDGIPVANAAGLTSGLTSGRGGIVT